MIAAITSCTNTSNPSVLIAAGLLARKAVAKGLTVKPWVKTSLAPGSRWSPTISPRPACRSRSRRARLQPRRLRLHHLHRQFRPAARGDLEDDRTSTTWSPPRCSPATATSRAASIRTCAPTTSPRRRWSWPTRWPARCSIDLDHRAARQRQGRQAGLPAGTSGRSTQEIADIIAQDVTASMFRRATPTSSRATPTGRRSRSPAGQTYDWDDGLDLRAEPALFRGHDDGRPAPVSDIDERAHARPVRRLDHHRPHLARPARSRQASPGRQLSASSTRCAPADFNPTARGAAITR